MRRNSRSLPGNGWTAGGIALLAALMLSGVAAAVNWQEPTFLVIKMDPYAKYAPGAIPDGTKAPLLQLEQAAAGRLDSTGTQMMDEIGDVFQKADYKEPTSLRGFGGKRIVWKFTFPGGAPLGDPALGNVGEYVRAACDLQSRFADNNDWLALHDTQGPDFYLTAAHELFHPIQEEYEYSKSGLGGARCRGEALDWIDEGSAEAVGAFMAEWKHGSSWAKQDYNLGFFGLRPYDASLHKNVSWLAPHVRRRVDPDQIPYYTSSFWRYLMSATSMRTPNKTRPGAPPGNFREVHGQSATRRSAVDRLGGRKNTAKHWGPFHEVYTRVRVGVRNLAEDQVRPAQAGSLAGGRFQQMRAGDSQSPALTTSRGQPSSGRRPCRHPLQTSLTLFCPPSIPSRPAASR